MKMLFGILLVAGITLAPSCNKESGGLPPCLRAKLTNGGSDCVIKVEEHLFHGEKVYRQVVSGCADFPTDVVNSKCEIVCSCCGITGIPTGPVQEFEQQATFVRVVWER